MSRKVILSVTLLALAILLIDLACSVVTFVGDPAVCAWSNDRDRTYDPNAPLSVYSSIDIFVRSSHDRLLHKHWDGTNWGNWEPIDIHVNGRRQPALSSPSVVQRGRDKIDVFTTNGTYVFRTWWDGRIWRSEAIQNMPEMISSAPAASSWDSNRIDLFVIGADGNLWHKFFEENRGWDRLWENLGRPSGYRLRSDPAAASIGPGCIDVVVLTENGYYHKRYRDPERGWNEWTPIPGTQFGNDKRACVTSPILIGAPNCAGYTYFFAVDNDGLLTKGDYHPSRTSALVGQDIQQDIEYSEMGRAFGNTQKGSAPAVVGYWNPIPLQELSPPPLPERLIHDPGYLWTIFYRSPSDNALWLETWGFVGPVPDSTPASIDAVVWDEGSRQAEPTEPLVTVLLPKVILDNNTDLPGSDYKNLELSTANPNLCALECSVDSVCKAFTYVKPSYQGPNAQCWLKNAVPAQVQAECCISGVKRDAIIATNAGSPEVTQQLEPSQTEVAVPSEANIWTSAEIPEADRQPVISQPGSAALPQVSMIDNIDLPGSDYRSFDLNEANPTICAKMCADDPQCKAFVYGKPGYQGLNAYCWLKNAVPGQVQSECCVSGIKGVANGITSTIIP